MNWAQIVIIWMLLEIFGALTKITWIQIMSDWVLSEICWNQAQK